MKSLGHNDICEKNGSQFHYKGYVITISVQSVSASSAPVKCNSWQRGNRWQEQRRWQQHGSQLIWAPHYHACWVMAGWLTRHIRHPTAQGNSNASQQHSASHRTRKTVRWLVVTKKHWVWPKLLHCCRRFPTCNHYEQTKYKQLCQKWDNLVYLKRWLPQKCLVLKAKIFRIHI